MRSSCWEGVSATDPMAGGAGRATAAVPLFGSAEGPTVPMACCGAGTGDATVPMGGAGMATAAVSACVVTATVPIAGAAEATG